MLVNSSNDENEKLMRDPDRRLIREAKQGNAQAYGELVEIYQDRVLQVAYDLFGNYEDAKDLAQEVFIRIYRNLHKFQERSLFSTWLYRITVNLAMDFHRRRSKSPFQSLGDGIENIGQRAYSEYLETPWLPECVNSTEMKNRIDHALDKLSLNQRTAIVLKYFHYKSTKEIADIMDCNENTVRIHHFRAIKKLKKYLQSLKS